KPAISNTQRISDELFQQVHNMDEIAEQRKLSVNTNARHLTTYILDGEISATKFMPRDKLETMTQLIRQTEQPVPVKPNTDLLPDDYTYGDIRIAQAHYEYMKKS